MSRRQGAYPPEARLGLVGRAPLPVPLPLASSARDVFCRPAPRCARQRRSDTQHACDSITTSSKERTTKQKKSREKRVESLQKDNQNKAKVGGRGKCGDLRRNGRGGEGSAHGLSLGEHRMRQARASDIGHDGYIGLPDFMQSLCQIQELHIAKVVGRLGQCI